MKPNQLYLFKDKRFMPMFIVQFCGCLNDSILKNALIILITFKLSDSSSLPPYILVMLANIALVAPFLIFASLAGQLADRYERSTIVQIIKFIEIAIVMLSAYGFYHTNLNILFTCIVLMGIHSTFFGPIKYSVLPDKLKKDELLGANGYLEAGTFLSILMGTMIGGFYNSGGIYIIAFSLIVAVIGFVASLLMPRSNNFNPDVKIGLNLFKDNIAIVKHSASRTPVYLAILGISWFWFIGAAIMAQIPSLTKETLGADENVANLFLAAFSIGVGVGSFWCGKIFANQITTKYVFLAAIGITICGVDLFFASRIAAVTDEPENLKTVFDFLSKLHYWRILIDLFLLAVVGGLYVVPLFAVMQYFSSPAYRSRVIAANNFMNAVFMAGSTVILSLLFYMGFSIPAVILIVSMLNLVVAYHIYQYIPETRVAPVKLLQAIAKIIFFFMYDVEVRGMSNYRKAGKRTVIVANHLSYIEPALLASYLPEHLTFVINAQIAREWWVKPFLNFVPTFPVEPNSPMALKSVIAFLQKGKKIAIFPEGRTSTSGSLMKVYEGPALIADKANATILPIRVEGTEFTIFSKLRKIMKGGFTLRRKITITILPPVKLEAPEHLSLKERRKYLGQALADVMSFMVFESSNYKQTLFQSLIDSAKTYGYSREVMEDFSGAKTTYHNLLLKSFILADLVGRGTSEGEVVGLMMPNMVATMTVFFGIQASGRVPAMINFTSGEGVVVSTCKTAGIRTIYTSKKFIKKAELQDLVSFIEESQIRVIYLENLKPKVNLSLKLKCFIGSLFPNYYYNSICNDQDDQKPAVILFTSGTEGQPKAVALSHRNLQANRYQVGAKLDFSPKDYIFNALPLFHSFGLTGSLVMALRGIKTFLYPSPLHYKVIPEIIYDIGATVMFSTDTFLRGYAENSHPYDFYSLRYIVAGAEKLQESTRQLMFNKFGIRTLEGYGATEASPVVAANTPINSKTGTVGRIMPGMEYYLQPVEGITEGGRLCIKGPNVMLGYMKPDNPGVIQPPVVEKLGENWYDTGDIVSVDADGYITILGREKRFAKVAGEMVSLGVVEELALALDQDSSHAAISVHDEHRGEEIILYTTSHKLTREKFTKLASKRKVSSISTPREIIVVKEIPVLATGKIDYRAIVAGR